MKTELKSCRSTKNNSLAPIRLSRTAWYYEKPKGLVVVAEARNPAGHHVATTIVTIPWHKLETSIARHKKKVR